MNNIGRNIMLPKYLASLGGYEPSVFWSLSPTGYKYYAVEALKALGFELISISQDGFSDYYTIPEKWEIEENDEESFKFSVRKKEGKITVEGLKNKFLKINAPVDMKYHALMEIATSKNQVLIPKFPDLSWFEDGKQYPNFPHIDWYKEGMKYGKPIDSRVRLFYASSLDFKLIPFEESKSVNRGELNNFYKVTLPKDSEITIDDINQTMEATFTLDGKRTNLIVEWRPGWYFNGRRNAKMKVNVDFIDEMHITKVFKPYKPK